MSDFNASPIELAKHVLLEDAIDLAAIEWGCDASEAWVRLRPFLISGAIGTKRSLPSLGLQEIPPGDWRPRKLKEGRDESAARAGKGWPVYVDKDALIRLLMGSPQDLHEADTAILLHIYDEAGEPSSRVPVGALQDALGEIEGARFYRMYIEAMRAGLFDDKGLERLSRSEWASLDSLQLRELESNREAETIRDYWISRTALPLNVLRAWAAKFDAPLPSRFSGGAPDEVHTSSPPKVRAKGRGGRKANVDKDSFWAKVGKLVDEGLQADPRVAGHTVEKLVEAMEIWAERHMQQRYERSTIRRYIEDQWARLQERSRTRIN